MTRRPPTKDDLLAVLYRHCIGAENGFGVAILAIRLRCAERHVRTLVSALREDGIAVCGTPKTGYFVASTPEELEQSCRFLRRRALHSLRLESQLRRIPLPDLIGQLKLET